ncbi:hypothetical protein BJY00DRAFT_326724 [Aspergillus carlsbadensis]|nr:hypothetical protein BJY00DRAFT_326724 [Aspergillus carlsbadensis]
MDAEQTQSASASGGSTGNGARFPGHVDWSTYPFLELRDSSLSRDDLTFLSAKGCLSLPNTHTLHEFVRNYFLYVHPGFPVLDEAEFWASYTRSRVGYSKIPLFILQAVLFASCPYVSLGTIQACGFRTKTEARNAFYKRAKYLFDFHGEESPLAQTQGALLLSHHASAAEPQAGTDWLARAIQSAFTLDNLPEASVSVDLLSKKRLWWSIVLRDRCLCLALHRRTQMPVIDRSLQIDTLDEDDFTDEITNSYVYEPPTKRVLVNVLKEHYGLALALSDMMPLVYSSHGIRVPSLSRDAFNATIAKVRCVESTLDRWRSATRLPSLMDQKANESVAVFVNLVYMYYYSARINLTHFELLTIENHPNYTPANIYTTRLTRAATTLTESTHHLTNVLEVLGHHGKTHTLPLSLLGCLPMPLLTTALDISMASSPSQISLHKRRLRTLGQVLRSLEQVYEAAAMISAGMSHFLHLAYMTVQLPFDLTGINTPSHIPEQPTSTSMAVGGVLPSRTWKDFLLQSPRAYLLISTTVDYSLCIGHLPHDHALPDMLTCVSSGSLKIRFPWNGSEDEFREEVQKAVARRRRTGYRGYKMARRVHLARDQSMMQGGTVNLDYLDLNAAR